MYLTEDKDLVRKQPNSLHCEANCKGRLHCLNV